MIRLPIKKIYYEEIKSGVKKIEYRNYTKFFKNAFNKNPKKIRLHYYANNYIDCNIIKIDLVNIPKRFKDSSFLYTSKVYAVHIEFINEYK